MFCSAIAWGAGVRPVSRSVGDLWRVSACSWFVNIWLVCASICGVDWAPPVACRAFPNNWFDVVPPTLTFHPRMRWTVFADAVVAGWAAHATNRRTLRFAWWIMGASACVYDRVRVASALLLQGEDPVHNSITDSRRIMLQLFKLAPCRVRVLMRAVALQLL